MSRCASAFLRRFQTVHPKSISNRDSPKTPIPFKIMSSAIAPPVQFLFLLNYTTTEHAVAIVKNHRLPGSRGELRVFEFHTHFSFFCHCDPERSRLSALLKATLSFRRMRRGRSNLCRAWDCFVALLLAKTHDALLTSFLLTN